MNYYAVISKQWQVNNNQMPDPDAMEIIGAAGERTLLLLPRGRNNSRALTSIIRRRIAILAVSGNYYI